MTKQTGSGRMAFYHEKGFVPAIKQAMQFAGKDGRIGTMPDAIDARLATPPYKELGMTVSGNETPWDRYYTTMTAEYFGILAGRSTVIVAHGIGPMSTLEGALKAYSHQYGDKTRKNQGGRISQEEFIRIASGVYGDVSIIDFEEYRSRFAPADEFRNPFGYRRVRDAHRDPLLLARLGPKAHTYIERHAALARQFHLAQSGRDVNDPFIIEVSDPNNLPYWCRAVEEGFAFAHLTSIGSINVVHHTHQELPSWATSFHAHEWGDGVRVLGIRAGSNSEVSDGPDPRQLLREHWQELFVPSGLERAPDGLVVLMDMPDGTKFTQVPKNGASADSYEPEFRVTSAEKVGELARFYTGSNYPVPIFRYELREAQGVLPEGANAYELVGEPAFTAGVGSRETCLVQGYRIGIDHTQRLVRRDALAYDLDRMMRLMGESAA